MTHLAVLTAIGKDEPGVVAALARVVYDAGGNLDDASMTRLHGIFAMMLAVIVPDGPALDALVTGANNLRASHGLTVTVESGSAAPGASDEPDHVVTVYGADRPGIVLTVADHLAARHINITDMDTRLAGTEQQPIYIMVLEVAAGSADLAGALDSIRADAKVDVAVQAVQREAL